VYGAVAAYCWKWVTSDNVIFQYPPLLALRSAVGVPDPFPFVVFRYPISIVPAAVASAVQFVLRVVADPPAREKEILIFPPALKKYLAASALAKETLCVNVNRRFPAPPQAVENTKLVGALSVNANAHVPAFVIAFVNSVDRLDSIDIVFPATTVDIGVYPLVWYDLVLFTVAIRPAHWAAVTVLVAITPGIPVTLAPRPYREVPTP